MFRYTSQFKNMIHRQDRPWTGRLSAQLPTLRVTVIHRSLRHHHSLRQRPLPVEDLHLNWLKKMQSIRIAHKPVEHSFRGERNACLSCCSILLCCELAHHSKPSDSLTPQLFLQLRVYRESILYAHMIDYDGCSCHKNSQAQARTAVNSLRDKQRYSAERSTRGMLPGWRGKR